MNRLVKTPKGKIVKAVRIYYDEAHGYYLRGDEFATGAVILSIATIYGPLYATIALADDDKGDRVAIRFDTEAPNKEMAVQAELDGVKTTDLPPQVVWDLNVDLLVYLHKHFKSRITSAEHYPSRPDGQVVEVESFSRTVSFGNKLIKQVAEQLDDLDITKEGAVLGLLRRRHQIYENKPHKNSDSLALEHWKGRVRINDLELESWMSKNFRAGMIGHSSKEIRIQGMVWLALNKTYKSSKAQAGRLKR